MAEERGIHADAKGKNQQQTDQAQDKTWHRPQLERLRVSLDTALDGGSVTDGQTGMFGTTA